MRPAVLDTLEALGHKVFTDGLFNLNLIGIRSRSPVAGKFDDTLVVVYRDKRGWIERRYPITTDPGTYYLDHPMSVKGTAVMAPGQYRGAYILGLHKGYRALVQNRPIKVWRQAGQVYDTDDDGSIDWSTAVEDEGIFAVNIHASDSNPYDESDRERGEGAEIGRWSAGCQVFANSSDFRAFMSLAVQASETWGNRFTYTLIEAPE